MMNILITGISGSLGKEVTLQLLTMSNVHVYGYSRDEHKQQALSNDPNIDSNRVTLVLGDVRDKDRLLECSRGMDYIFHFAANKHVDRLEENPEEAIKTNILGTDNVLHAQRLNKIPRVVFSSTDKAAEPINTYGMCKGIAERLVMRNKNNVVCRYGNVMASNGSVIPLFINSIRKNGRVKITNHECTRFWIRIQDAAGFVINTAFSTLHGLQVPQMKASTVTRVGLMLSNVMGVEPTFEEIGLRPGEKIHECLKASHEGQRVTSQTAEQFTNSELEELLAPIVREHDLHRGQ